MEKVLYVDPHDVKRAFIAFPQEDPDRNECVVALIL